MKKLLKFIWIVLESHAQARAAAHLVHTGRRREAMELMNK